MRFMAGRVVPWRSWKDWQEVGGWLLSEEPQQQQRGLDRVRAACRVAPWLGLDCTCIANQPPNAVWGVATMQLCHHACIAASTHVYRGLSSYAIMQSQPSWATHSGTGRLHALQQQPCRPCRMARWLHGACTAACRWQWSPAPASWRHSAWTRADAAAQSPGQAGAVTPAAARYQTTACGCAWLCPSSSEPCG